MAQDVRRIVDIPFEVCARCYGLIPHEYMPAHVEWHEKLASAVAHMIKLVDGLRGQSNT